MSITATIDEPKDKLEKEFNVMVCSESLYKHTILIVANNHNLTLFKGWGIFTEIDTITFGQFSDQLITMKEGIINLHEINETTKKYILERLDFLKNEIADVLKKRNDLVILIG